VRRIERAAASLTLRQDDGRGVVLGRDLPILKGIGGGY